MVTKQDVWNAVVADRIKGGLVVVVATTDLDAARIARATTVVISDTIKLGAADFEWLPVQHDQPQKLRGIKRPVLVLLSGDTPRAMQEVVRDLKMLNWVRGVPILSEGDTVTIHYGVDDLDFSL